MYIFYIDESGNRDIKHLDQERFYVLTAVGMFEQHWKKFYLDIARSKRAILERINKEYSMQLDFVTDTEVKSTLLRNNKAQERHPFSKLQTTEERKELVDKFYSQLDNCHAVLISVVMDKKHIFPTSRLAEQQALHDKAWEMLCERIESYMKEYHTKHKAILVTDDTDKQKNLQTTRAHVNLYRNGATSGLALSHIIEMPMFVSSATCAGVQLADLCCYNVYRRFKVNDSNYDFFRRIEPYFYNSSNTDPKKKDGLKIFPPESEFANEE